MPKGKRRMKFSVGDRIKIKSTGQSGEIIEIYDDFFLDVLIDGDQDPIPVPREQIDYSFAGIYKQHQEDKKAKSKVYVDNLKVEGKVEKKYDLSDGFYLIFRPVYREHEGEELVNRFDIYVYNQLEEAVYFKLKISVKNQALFDHQGHLPSGNDYILYSMTFDDATENPLFSFAFSSRANGSKEFAQIKLSRKKLMDKLFHLEKESLALFDFLIIKKLGLQNDKFEFNSELLEKLKQPKKSLHQNYQRHSVKKAKEYIDLHIEKICPDSEMLNKDEILEIQLNFFQKELDLAWMDKRIDVFTVVHGLGDGILQEKVRKMCNKISFVSNCKQDFRNPGQSLIFFKNT